MSSKALAQTQDKALQLNLASTIYGTFAEIGAGQETANWFSGPPEPPEQWPKPSPPMT